MEIVIYEVRSGQLRVYKDFFGRGLLEDEENFRMTHADDLNSRFPTIGSEDSFTLSAYYGNDLVGTVSFTREGADREKLVHKGLLFRMYVSPGHRGKGIGQKLIQEVIDRASALNNMEHINLTVVATNEGAKKLYEKFGFVTYGIERNGIKWKGKYFDEELMSLQLKIEK